MCVSPYLSNEIYYMRNQKKSVTNKIFQLWHNPQRWNSDLVLTKIHPLSHHLIITINKIIVRFFSRFRFCFIKDQNKNNTNMFEHLSLSAWGVLHESPYSLREFDFYSLHFTDEEGRLWGVKELAPHQEVSYGGSGIQAQVPQFSSGLQTIAVLSNFKKRKL